MCIVRNLVVIMRQPVPRVFFHALNLFFVDWLPQHFRRETQDEVSYRHEFFYGWILAVLDVCEAQHWRQHNLSSPSLSFLNLVSISVPPGSAMLTATSSHPSRNFSEYGVMSVHPMPCPPDFASGRVYHIDPSEPYFAKARHSPGDGPHHPGVRSFSPNPHAEEKDPPAAADIAFFSTRRLGLVALVSLRSSFTPSPSVFKTAPFFWWENDDDDDDDDDAVTMVTQSRRRPRPPRREEESGRGGARHFDHKPSWFFERAVVVVVVVVIVVVVVVVVVVVLLDTQSKIL